MHWIQHQFVMIVGAWMMSNLPGAIQNAYGGVRGHQGERAADGFRRDRVIAEIEADFNAGMIVGPCYV